MGGLVKQPRRQMLNPDVRKGGTQSAVVIGNTYLVGGFNPSEKYEFVSWDDCSQYITVIKFHGSKHFQTS